MKETVQKLLDSKISAAEISRQTGVSDAMVKRLRLGSQNLEGIYYSNMEKLYNYQVEIEKDQKHINEDYDKHLEEMKHVYNLQDYNELLRMNGNIYMMLRRQLRNMGFEEDSDDEAVQQLYDYIDLLSKARIERK
ncbi:hypothetical protein JY665_14260 [Staphylococcus aureus]|uniref:hypothetical protein n=1 Tax=Staphylococcus TaxID=1279 RepID=UPI000445CC42|nr:MULTISPECIES: hypothetical protein [Staphylococcus]MBG3203052.1 hypothetical protein [Staphylococcus aureus]MDN0189227.1 hypothetical protein [Staphylococcus arlettae]QKU19864.1 hypothetical protein FOC52_13770 [Staphylococcus cohnii]EVJ48879.1 hypothetical protein U042_02794 [Staphylococcus aureus UCIM6147]MBN5857126.1 hypothetical protein [Staphylococcus aureus]